MNWKGIIKTVCEMTPASRLNPRHTVLSLEQYLNPSMDKDFLYALAEVLPPVHWKHGQKRFIDLLLEKIEKSGGEDEVSVHRFTKLVFEKYRDELWVKNALAPALRMVGAPSPTSVAFFVFSTSEEDIEKTALKIMATVNANPVLRRAFDPSSKKNS